jgi:hypothetical protein
MRREIDDFSGARFDHKGGSACFVGSRDQISQSIYLALLCRIPINSVRSVAVRRDSFPNATSILPGSPALYQFRTCS